MAVHEAHFLHLVTQLSDSGDQAHLFGDVVADQPEVDDVTAGAKSWRGLDEQAPRDRLFAASKASVGPAIPTPLMTILMCIFLWRNVEVTVSRNGVYWEGFFSPTYTQSPARIRNSTLSRPIELRRVPSRMPPIFSTARCDRKLLGPTRKTTLSTNRKACASISRFISPL